MTDKEAMKLALFALDIVKIHYTQSRHINEAITALKERLAQPEQEPVALPCCGYTDASAIKWNSFNGVVQCHNCGQTYTPPQRTWVGLGEDYRAMYLKVRDELAELQQRTWVELTDEQMLECNMDGDFVVDREIAKLNVQAKLKEKNS